MSSDALRQLLKRVGVEVHVVAADGRRTRRCRPLKGLRLRMLHAMEGSGELRWFAGTVHRLVPRRGPIDVTDVVVAFDDGEVVELTHEELEAAAGAGELRPCTSG